MFTNEGPDGHTKESVAHETDKSQADETVLLKEAKSEEDDKLAKDIPVETEGGADRLDEEDGDFLDKTVDGEFHEGYAPRKSHVETIVESDEEIDYAYTSEAKDETEKARDNLVYQFGCTKVLVPKKRIVKSMPETEDASTQESEFYHEEEDIKCLLGKTILFYFSSVHFPTEHYKGVELKDMLRELILETTDFQIDIEDSANQGITKKNDFAVVFLSRDKNQEDFDQIMKNQPFYAIPFKNSKTRETLATTLGIDGLVLSQRRQKVIVYTPETGVITSKGKACLLYNRDHCVEEWRKKREGFSLVRFITHRFFPF